MYCEKPICQVLKTTSPITRRTPSAFIVVYLLRHKLNMLGSKPISSHAHFNLKVLHVTVESHLYLCATVTGPWVVAARLAGIYPYFGVNPQVL